MIKKNRSGKFGIAAIGLTIAAAIVALLTWSVYFVQETSGQTLKPDSILIPLTGEERDWLRKHPVLRVAQDPGWPPVEFAGARGEPAGMADYSLLWKALAIFAVVLAGLIIWNRKLSGEIRHRKKTEDALQTSEAFLNNIIEQSPYAIWISDDKGTLLRMNQACRDLLNITDEEVVGRYNVLEDNIVQEQGVMPLVKQVFEQGRSVRFNLEYDSAKLEHPALKHKTFVILDVIIFPIKDSDGRVANAVIQHIDITKRKQAEEALRESEYLQKAILNNIPDIAWIKNLEGKYIALNEAFAQSCGAVVDDIAGKTDFDLWPFDLAQKYSADDRQVIQSGERKIYEETLVDNEGKTILVETIKTPLYNDKREIIGTAGIAHDITQRKKAEKALREEKNKAQHYLDIAGVIFIALDVSQKVTLINKTGCRVLGYDEQEVIGKDWFDTFLPDGIRARTKEAFQKLMSGEIEQAEYFENPVLTKDGKERLVAWHNAILKDESGNITGTLSSGEDITERKKAEEALQTSEAELHDSYFAQAAINMILSESLENIPLEIILQKVLNIILSVPWLTFEPIGNIQLLEDDQQVLVMKAQSNLPEAVKKATARVPFGQCLCGKAALTQQIQFADHDMCLDICHEGMPPYGHYATPVVFSGRTLGVINIFLKEGHERNEKEEEFLLAVADTLAGIIVRRLVEAEREKLHAQLLQAQKMEAVGQLAGGIAHDFNNILTAMIGYGHMLKIKMQEDDPLRSYADHILSLSDRAANLTQSLLAFSRKQIMNPKPVNLNEIIRKVERLLSRIIGEDIELKTALAETEFIIMADTMQIEQVLMNLVTNARDAMPEGGELLIRTEMRELDQVFIKTHGFGKQGRYVLVSVSDTGSGMDEKTKEHIFEPFFTTKDVGKGTGLGLAMAYGIIKQHEGYINVYSKSGKGTIFNIYLPLIQGRAEDINPDDIHPIERGTETILLAEDNNDVRAGTKIILEEYGYKVIEAVDGEDAVSKFQRYKDNIDVVILDVIMPKKNGKEAYEEIRRIRPDIAVVFTSGYTADIIRQKGNLAEGVEFILKPATPRVLIGKIRGVLEGKKE